VISIDSINITEFKRFCDRLILFEERGQKIRDSRKAPQISAWLILKTVFYNAIFGGRSLLQADQLARKETFRKYVGSTRKQVVSDTTMHTSIGGMDSRLLQEWMRIVYQKAKTTGMLKVKTPQLGNLRIGAIDGTGFGKFLASCFEIVAQPSIFIGLEKIPKRGKELPTSTKLLRKMVKRLGKRFIDLLLVDGLYFSHEFINTCVEVAGIDVLIKLKGEEGNSLNILKDAEGIFSLKPLPPEVEYIQGTDDSRMVSFAVWAAGKFAIEGSPFAIKVAKVKEVGIKDAQERIFWVITTRAQLNANQMRVGAHIRWTIENNGFKALNRQTNSKHVWTHDANEWEVLTQILLLAFALLELFISQLDMEKIRKVYGGVSTTMRFICSAIEDSLIAIYSAQKNVLI